MKISEQVVGVLLAGGRSSRMGGGDKCLRLLGNRPILASIIERLKPQVAEMILNANGEPSRFARFGLPVVADNVTGFAGPLAGVHASLEWVKANRADIRYVVTVATDTPFFPADLVPRFLAELNGKSTLLVARSEAGVHPVIGLWDITLASELEASLEQGMLKAGAFAEQHRAVEIDFPPVEVGGRLIDPFFNINRPEDLAEAETLLGEPSL